MREKILDRKDKQAIIVVSLIVLGILFIVGFVFMLVQISPEDSNEDLYRKCTYKCPSDSKSEYINLECPKMCKELLSCNLGGKEDVQ